MKSSAASDEIALAPRWTIRSVVFALGMTGLLFLLLPLTERFSVIPEPDLSVREIKTLRVPPPLKPPPPQALEAQPSVQKFTNLPEPVLQEVAPPALTLRVPVDLQAGIRELTGSYDQSFQIREEGLVAGMASAVFEIADLDRPPLPLVRVNPLYPPQARMRKIEGYVTVEFIVGIDGSIEEVQIVESEPGDLFVRTVERAVRGWRFEAGEVQGEKVASRVRQRIDFTLD